MAQILKTRKHYQTMQRAKRTTPDPTIPLQWLFDIIKAIYSIRNRYNATINSLRTKLVSLKNNWRIKPFAKSMMDFFQARKTNHSKIQIEHKKEILDQLAQELKHSKEKP